MKQTTGVRGRSLKNFLQTSNIPKVCFDVGKSSGALFALFDIALDDIQDIQLIHYAARQRLQRSHQDRYLHSLERCINRDAQLSVAEEQAWNHGLDLIIPERGGWYEDLNDRPLRLKVLAYCVQEDLFVPRLRDLILQHLSPHWKMMTEKEAKRRVRSAQGLDPKA